MIRLLLFVYTAGLLLLLGATNVAGMPISSAAVKASQFSAGADTLDIPSVLQPRGHNHIVSSEANTKAKEAYKVAAALQRKAETTTEDNTLKSEHHALAKLLDDETNRYRVASQEHLNRHLGNPSNKQPLPTRRTVDTNCNRAFAIQTNTMATIEHDKAKYAALALRLKNSKVAVDHNTESTRHHQIAQNLISKYPAPNHIPNAGIEVAFKDGKRGTEIAKTSRKHMEEYRLHLEAQKLADSRSQ